jgi:regulator of sirC expression with transglutaminase-like and TPR domain
MTLWQKSSPHDGIIRHAVAPAVWRRVFPQPANAKLRAALAFFLANAGHTDQALTAMTAALALNPIDPRMLLDYAALLDRHGDTAAARVAYRAFLARSHPTSIEFSVSLQAVRERYKYLLEHADANLANSKGVEASPP